MTYRQWLRKAKETRAAAVPDIRDRLPLTVETATPAVSRSAVMRRVIAGIAAAAVLVFTVGYMGWQELFGGNAGSTPAVSAPDEGEKIPLHTVVRAVTMLHSTTPTVIVDNMSGYVGARLMYVTYNTPPEHSECQGVFYDMEQQQYFCADHLMKAALEREGIPTAGLYMHYYHPVYGKIVFTCKDSARSSYVYDITNDTFHRLPVSLYHCPGVIGSLQTTHPYVFLHKMGGGRDDLYLINLLTAELTYILKDSKGNYLYTPMDDVEITEDGKFAHYTLAKGGGDVVNSPARTTVLYDIAAGESRTFVGEIVSYLSDTERFFLNTPDGYVVYDIASGEKTSYAESDLPAYYAYYTKQTDIYTEFDYRLMLCNRITGEEELVTNEYVVASVISEQYLYYYIRGEEFLRVRDMVGGGVEYLPLDKSLVQEIESEENKDRAIRFGLQVEEDREEVWLYYSVTDTPRQDSELIRREREEFPLYSLNMLMENSLLNAISSLEPILRKFPGYVTAYEGDGFLYLDFTGLTTNVDGVAQKSPLIVLEDYESGMFYKVTHFGETYDSSFSFTKGVTLTGEDESNTRAMLEELDIPVKPAYRDYRPYFSDDPQVKIQVYLSEITVEKISQCDFKYFVRRETMEFGYGGEVPYLEDNTSCRAFRKFVAFTDTLAYYALESDLTEHHYYHTYYLHCVFGDANSAYFYIGVKDGKPFLCKNRCVATLTEAQYAKWSAWMDKQEQKCRATE